uniref:Uncharacterized protein n=1 Tax=Cacopsylla melanoneura TaxID=428564 RepID=A0A8D9EBI9_9HEMI
MILQNQSLAMLTFAGNPLLYKLIQSSVFVNPSFTLFLPIGCHQADQSDHLPLQLFHLLSQSSQCGGHFPTGVFFLCFQMILRVYRILGYILHSDYLFELVQEISCETTFLNNN